MSKKSDKTPPSIAPPEVPKRFTGTVLTLVASPDNLAEVKLLTIENGVVVTEQLVTDPDAPSITISKAESILWKMYSSLREGF